MRSLMIFLVALGPACGAHAASVELCHVQSRFAIVVHGGVISQSSAEEKARLEIMKGALDRARSALRSGATALDVVETAVKTFEDSGKFNAGKGAIANTSGFVETDASIMDGKDMRAGAVASMTGIKNPVVAARLVMEKSPHVLMVGDRGEAYVRSLGAEAVNPSYFVHNKPDGPTHGTVGAAALDRCGHIAAATSTGGITAKATGRVGDSPIVGAGVYAADDVGGFSATGHGEIFIRLSIAKDVADRMRYAGQSMAQAMQADITDKLGEMKEEGALIGVDKNGNVQAAYVGEGLFRGFATDEEAPVVAVHEGPLASRPR
jgi:L-asparaginase / beta-aspartyl-peptidase